MAIYEINTWVWLADLSRQSAGPVDLGSVSGAEWDAIAQCGFAAVWLMGVWERSPAGIAIANKNNSLLQSFQQALPDFTPADNVGSAYCIRNYQVDPHLGGPAGLVAARRELAARGMRLILDFVPNHVAPDCPTILEQPSHYLQGTAADLQAQPHSFLQLGTQIFAFGKDPYFAPWPDVIQVNAFSPGFQQAATEQLLSIAEQCDGVRCDMAMLLINRIFAQTWGTRAGEPPATEYWPTVISAVRQQHAGFLFGAEAYWGLERELLQQGFDYCYDKTFYDRLAEQNPSGLLQELSLDPGYQRKLVRFIENHDEPRAATEFPGGRGTSAALAMATVPGARLFHEGQLTGRHVRVPPFLGRRPEEPVDPVIADFYRLLLKTIQAPVFREGDWALCKAAGWTDNQSCQAIASWCWTREEDRRLVLINLSGSTAQARVHLPWQDLAGGEWILSDALSAAIYDRAGDELQQQGLYVELTPWQGQILSFKPQ